MQSLTVPRSKMMSILFSSSGQIHSPCSFRPNVEKWSDDDLLEYADEVRLFRTLFGTSPLSFLEAERHIESTCEASGVRYVPPVASDGPAESMVRRGRMALFAKKSEFERRLRRRCEECGASYECPPHDETLLDRDGRISSLNASIRRAQARIRGRRKKAATTTRSNYRS